MDKALDLKSGLFADISDLRQRQLPRGNDPCHTLFFQKRRPVCPCNRHLSAGMDVKTRKMSPHILYNSHILHNYRIQSRLIQRQQVIIES